MASPPLVIRAQGVAGRTCATRTVIEISASPAQIQEDTPYLAR